MIGEIIGQEISVNVPKNMKAQVIPQGNSKQNTREGYNLFDYMNKLEPSGNHGIKIDKDLESGYVTFNGTPDGSYIPIVVDFACDDLLEDGESYTIWQENHVSSDFGGIYIQVRVTNKEDSSTYNVFSATSNQHFTVNKSKYSYKLGIQTGTLTDAGTFNNYKNRYMLYKGTDDKAFELYGASPSLDYPSEVQAVGDNINLYPFESIEFQSNTPTESWCYIDGKVGAYGNTVTDKTDYKITLEKGKYYFKLETDDSNIITGGLVANDTNSEKLLTSFDNAFEITETTVCTLRLKVANPSLGINIKSIKLEKGTTATAYSPYGQGNIEIIHNNKNFLNFPDRNVTQNGVTIQITNGNHFKITGTPTGIVNKILYDYTYFKDINKIAYNRYPITISRNTDERLPFELNFASDKSTWYMQITRDIVKRTKNVLDNNLNRIAFYTDISQKELNYEFDLQLEISKEVTDIIEPKENTYILPIQKPFYKIGNYADKFVKQDGKWYEQHIVKEISFNGTENWMRGGNIYPSFHTIVGDIINKESTEQALGLCNYFKAYSSVWFVDIIGFDIINIYSSEFTFRINLGSGSEITTVEAWKAKVQELYNAGTPIKLYYVLETPELIECTEEQTQILEQLNNLYLYEGINYLYSTDDPSPIFQFSYDKIVNDFKFYLSENGRLIFPKENISFLCSISESSIPSMPEALETSATIAGRDGDVPLSTTYGPMSFELVLYTEDNLTPEEKLKQEIFLNRFCNSIKNNTETFVLELAQKFYKIKYNGLLNKENYPKFLKFTLPFKSSKSFAYDVKKNTAYGNNTFESNTIEPTGFECVIKGPAIKPIISLNDYSIEYNNTILDDESLIIDTNNSTAVLVNSEGTRVNAMRYYNHQFPKILNGENELKILSGIDNPENVSISWYDLTL